jgi:hypothetical protein
MNDLKKIYFLDYVYEFDDGHEDIRLLGVFSSKEKAKIALQNITNNHKYKKIKKYIVMSEDFINRLGWTDGFVTLD